MTDSKKTPELRFPGFTEPWEEKKLGEVVKNSSSKYNPKKNDLFLESIELENIEQNTGRLISISRVDRNSSIKNIFKKDSILFGGLRPYLRKYYKTNVKGICSSEIWVLEPKYKIESEFIYRLVQTENFMKISNVTTGTKMPRADWDYMKKMKFNIPSLAEQENIGSFFSSLDKKLDLQKDKLEELKSYKKGMMQRIFDQEIRFKDENGRNYPDWQEKKLGDSIINIVDKVQNQNIPILSSTSKGIFLQSEYFKKNVASKDISDYKVVKRGDLTYRSMSDTGEFYFNIQNIIDIGAVSPAYPVFNFKDNINNTWFYYFINNSNSIKRQLLGIFQGGTRFALPISKFSLLKINLPSLHEQEKIASFLSSLDRKIELEEEKLRSYEEFKKGLMQRMFV